MPVMLYGRTAGRRDTPFSQQTALTEENRRPFLGPKTPCSLTPLLPKLKLLRARPVVGSVTTGESLVLYVFVLFLLFHLEGLQHSTHPGETLAERNTHIQRWWGGGWSDGLLGGIRSIE